MSAQPPPEAPDPHAAPHTAGAGTPTSAAARTAHTGPDGTLPLAAPSAPPTAPPPTPRLVRLREGRVVAGVCTGLAVHLGVRLTAVRVAFTLLMALGGVSGLLYLGVWTLTRRVDTAPEALPGVPRAHSAPPAAVTRPARTLDRVLAVVALVLLVAGSTPRVTTTVTVVLIAVGAMLVWRTAGPGTPGDRAEDRAGDRPGHPAADRATGRAGVTPGAPQWAGFAGGILLLVAAAAFVAITGADSAARTAGAPTGGLVVPTVLATVTMVVGLVVALIPLWLRLWTVAAAADRARAAEAERARIAAGIHDSVLQTLTLIQRRSTDPFISRMARVQERELRRWLFHTPGSGPDPAYSPTPASGDDPAPGTHPDPAAGSPATGPVPGAATTGDVASGTLFGALHTVCGEVEDLTDVTIRPVTVGTDRGLDGPLHALVLAAREAALNAATHSGCAEVHVFAEVTPSGVDVFVRDRGPGFSEADVPPDRHGVRHSIRDRMVRAGGDVGIDSGPRGTEVSLHMPS
ncbi:PspC domain-containing protein [Corynebacterium bovis]|uniref:PspC domain-containing protein n=2 Tax=Corynebacterium bovis TaxID=36808 RepID=UPI003080192E